MSTIAVVATVEASNNPPRVRLDVTDTGTPALTSTTITRLNADGTTVPVRTLDGNPLVLTTGTGLLYDYEAPYQAAVSYSSLETPGASSAQVTVNEDQVWLIHPGVPSLSMPIELRKGSLAEDTFGVQQGVFWVLGKENPTIVTDGTRKGMQSSLTVAVETASDVRAIRELIRDAGTLFLNIPVGLGYLVDSCYIAVGEVRRARVTDIGADPMRDVVMPFYVVDRPAGGSTSQRTYADVLAQNATYSSLPTKYSSYTALLAGP